MPALPSPNLLAVVPVLTGPLQVLLALLPAMLAAIGGLLLSMFRPRAMLTGLKLLWRLKLSLCVILLVVVGLVAGLRSRLARSSTTRPAHCRSHRIARLADGPRQSRSHRERPHAARRARPGRHELDLAAQSGAAVFSSPAVVGDRIYFISSTLSLASGGTATIHCLDAHTGRELWSLRPPAFARRFPLR